MESASFSIVIPAKIGGVGNGCDLFLNVGLKSYDQFLERPGLECIHIVCPENEISTFQQYTARYNLPLNFIAEETLLSDKVKSSRGWFKQQLIKLEIAKRINNPVYMVLDTDHYLNKRFGIKDMFHNGKIKLTSEPWHEENTDAYSTNSNWWKNSCKLLGYSVDNLKKETRLMGVTPQVFVTSYVRRLLDHVQSKFGEDWQKVLCDGEFTEFTMYWIFLLQNNLTDGYTSDGYPLWVHDHRTNILNMGPYQSMLDSIRRSFTESNSYFSVVQGYLNLDLRQIVHDIHWCLDYTKPFQREYQAVVLTAAMLKPNRRQSFAVQERFEQTIETVQSVRRKIPNAFCILIEGSVLTPEEEAKFNEHFDVVLSYGKDPTVLPYVNHPHNIGHGELKLLEKGMEFVMRHRIRSKYLFKLGARYFLDENFNLSDYNPDKYNFRQHIDGAYHFPVYTTGLYSIPVQRQAEFMMFLREAQNILTHKLPMIERVYQVMIPQEHIHLVETLGLTGKLSYNKKLFSV